ncbi:DUF4168 domain-containing protein [Alcaligenes ammonioxydans]|jgi:hypothetical protein|nr:DUF4168 domain-containing protein [Alcaligenes ammonioxydans]EJC61095.1 hypothetical protein QWA_16776 [Alcaligenes faecalis subsp. faecalis NCIB 8687]MCH1880247.1 DUF4168 domain-containing protein [Alcaligenes ammonioxydans]WGQ35000.1 DUF4168 domain-containing protein [Alcaligenes faecalis]HRK86858.1 DUF4168 domain-containing protein [Alcaligenes faecalis]
MQPSVKAFLAATAVAFGMYSPFAMAQGNAAPANSAAPAATQIVKPTDSQLEQYARTYKKVAQTASEYQPRLDAAKSDAERQAIVQEADQRLVGVVTSNGMDLADYNGISLAIQQDPALRQRVEGMLK